MLIEIETAAQFWSESLSYGLSYPVQQSFLANLTQLMKEKFSLHWYPQRPEQGQAMREVVFDPELELIDPLLEAAANSAGFDFVVNYGRPHGVRMWVDPGEVEIQNTCRPFHRRMLYQSSRSASPPPRITSPPLYQPEQMYYQSDSLFIPPESSVYYYSPHSSGIAAGM